MFDLKQLEQAQAIVGAAVGRNICNSAATSTNSKVAPIARACRCFRTREWWIACAKSRFEKEDLSMIGLRFFGDKTVPDERFATYRREFGDKFEAIEIDPKDATPGPMAPHSVLTINLEDRPGTPTKLAEERVIRFFRGRTGAV